MSIGLEYICKQFGVEYKEVASKLEVSQPTLQDWLKKRRKIPKKRLEQLSQLFGVEAEYFQKELTRSEELEIQMIRIAREKQEVEIEDVHIDDEGNEHWYTRVVDENEGVIQMLEMEKNRHKLLESIESLINIDFFVKDPHDNDAAEYRHELFSDLVQLFKEGNKKKLAALDAMIYYLRSQHIGGWGKSKAFHKANKEPEFRMELEKLLKKFEIINNK